MFDLRSKLPVEILNYWYTFGHFAVRTKDSPLPSPISHNKDRILVLTWNKWERHNIKNNWCSDTDFKLWQKWRSLLPAEMWGNKKHYSSTAKCRPVCRSYAASRPVRSTPLCESPNPLIPCPLLADDEGEGEEQCSARNYCGRDFQCHVGLNGKGTEPATKTLVDEKGIGMNIEWNGIE